MSTRATRMKDRARRHEEGAARALDGFVRTPPALAEQIVSGHVVIGALPRGGRVLEPSAGDGALVRMILSYDRDAHVTAIEPNGPRADAIRALAAEYPGQVDVHECQFEAWVAAHPGDRFDAVIMNPPFGNSTADRLWMAHARAAWELLHPGAQLVSVVPPSYAYRQDRAHKQFREWATAQGARYEELPGAPFKESDTGTRAGLLTLPRPVPARADGLPSWLYAPAQGVPVPVPGRPNVAASGLLAAPVQAYNDRSDGDRPRVLRFAGTCHGCGRLLWDHDGRGDASVWEACTLDADEYGKVGPSVAMCLDCYHQPAKTHPPALRDVARYWSDAPAAPAQDGPAVYPLDLGTGVWATVTGLDSRAEVSTITGRVMANPEPVTRDALPPACLDAGSFLDDRVVVTLRTAHGSDVELYAREDQAVTVWDVPDFVPVPAESGTVELARELPAAPDPAPVVSGWPSVLQPVIPGC